MAERPEHINYLGVIQINIDYGSTEHMLGGFGNGGYDFEEVKVNGEDAGIFHLPKGVSTRVVRITGNAVCMDLPIQGSGWYMIYRSGGNLEHGIFDVSQSRRSVVNYSKGDVVVWGASEEARIIDFTSEPFTPEMEENVAINDPSLSQDFWNIYNKHIDDSKK